jgi:hypothetical protein
MCLWLAILVNNGLRQERIAARVRSAGGQVFYDFESGTPIFPTWVRKWLGNGVGARVCRIDIAPAFPKMQDNDLEGFDAFRQLQQLWLWYQPITDQGLANTRIQRMRRLESLNLNNTQITDLALKHVGDVTSLRSLYLDETNVTNEGLAHLIRLRQLETLYLRDTRISDDGLEYLEQLADLQELDIEDTSVTDKGVARLQQKLPNCNVLWGESVYKALERENKGQ